MAFILVADGGDAVWVGAAKDPKKIVSKIGTMQRMQGGQAAPALDRASIVFQQVCHAKQAHAVEARAHKMLAGSLVYESWFACPAQTAIEALQAALAALAAQYAPVLDAIAEQHCDWGTTYQDLREALDWLHRDDDVQALPKACNHSLHGDRGDALLSSRREYLRHLCGLARHVR